MGNSNGPSHVAVAVDVPSLQLHGHTTAESWCPSTERHRALQSPEFGKVAMPDMAAIKVEAVWGELQQMRSILDASAASKKHGLGQVTPSGELA